SRSALAGDEDGRVHLRDAPRQIEGPQHGRTRADETGRDAGIDLPRRPTRLKLAFFLLERVGKLRESRIKAGFLCVEREIRRQLRSPLFLRANNGPANRITFATATILDRNDLLAVGA